MKGMRNAMNFWDTIRGVHLADTLIRILPKMEESLSTIAKGKRKQHASVVYKESLQEFLNDEFANGRVLVSMTAIDNVEEHLARFVVVTE